MQTISCTALEDLNLITFVVAGPRGGLVFQRGEDGQVGTLVLGHRGFSSHIRST